MIIADLAGIRVFATGGIGGVRRGAERTMDISADLQELARTNVAVVCAGAKSILDLRLTLEYLETMGVPVLGFQTHSGSLRHAAGGDGPGHWAGYCRSRGARYSWQSTHPLPAFPHRATDPRRQPGSQYRISAE